MNAVELNERRVGGGHLRAIGGCRGAVGAKEVGVPSRKKVEVEPPPVRLLNRLARQVEWLPAMEVRDGVPDD